jgi:hypothetical protein
MTVTVTVEGKLKDRHDDSDNLRNKDFEERQKRVDPTTLSINRPTLITSGKDFNAERNLVTREPLGSTPHSTV